MERRFEPVGDFMLMRSERTLRGYRYSALDAVLLRGLS